MPRESTTSTLHRSRLARAGAAGASAPEWALRIGAAALVTGVAVASWSLLRPLPSPSIDPPSNVVDIPRDLIERAPLAERERLLAQIADAGNIFAPDREPWTRAVAQSPDDATADDDAPEEQESETAASAALSPAQLAAAATQTGRASEIPFEAIPVTEAPPAGIQKDLRDLRLRGVYRTSSGPVALIGNIRDENRNGAKPRRIGETFAEEEWTVLAIDDAGKRVILSRAGVNVQLAMYTLSAEAARVSTPTPAVAVPVTKPSVVVMTRTPDQLRRELAEAGVSPAEIEELLALAAKEQPPAVAEAPADAPGTGAIPDAPEGLAELIKMMSTNSGPGGENGSRRERPNRRDRNRDKPPS